MSDKQGENVQMAPKAGSRFADDDGWPRCGGPDEGAQVGLAGLMTGISEECWCAGWLMGLEYILWRVGAGQRFGQGVITERQATLLRLLSDEAGGWFRWDDEAGVVFVPMEAWLEHIARATGAAP